MSVDAPYPAIPISSIRHPRAGFESIPKDITRAELLRYFTYTEDDLAVINLCRGSENRIGFALLLSGLRLTGRFPYDFELVPPHVLTHVCSQLRLSEIPLFLNYPNRRNTRAEHLERLRAYLGLRPFTEAEHPLLTAHVEQRVRAGARPHELLASTEQMLREQAVVLPGVTTLEHLLRAARLSVEEQIFQALGLRIPTATKATILAMVEKSTGPSLNLFQQLQQAAGQASPEAFAREVRLMEQVQAILPDGFSLVDFHPNLIERLAGMVSGVNSQTMRRYAEPKRLGLLVCWLWRLRTQLIDTALTMSHDLIAGVLRRAKNAATKEQQRQQKRVRQVLKLCGEVIRLILDEAIPDAEIRAALVSHYSAEQLQSLSAECVALGDAPSQLYLEELKKRYSYVRQFAPRLVESFTLRSVTHNAPLLRAVDYLRERNQQGQRGLDDAVPLEFIPPAWQEVVCPAPGVVDRPLWEICLLNELRQSLKSGNVHVPHSRTFQPVETYLIAREQWAAEKELLTQEQQLPLDFASYWPKLEVLLQANLRALNDSYPANPQLEIRDEQFHVARLEKLVLPPTAQELKKTIQQMIEQRPLTDLLLEVHDWTGFLHGFTRVTSGRPITDAPVTEWLKLLSCLLAEGCNLALSDMAIHGPGFSLDQLEEVKFSYLRAETLAQTAATLVNFLQRQWLSEHWGQGVSSSSDARIYGVPVRALNATFHPKYFAAAGRGVGIYTHVSDLWIPFYTQIITCHARQAPFVLDGLLYHGTRLEPKEHFTDTHGYTECLFAVAHLLGIRFCPRIKDLPEQRLWRLPDVEAYPHIEAVFAGKLRKGVIRESWEEIMRLIASIRSGEVRASLIVSKISAASHRNHLFRGLQELGRLLKTAYIAEYLCSEELRRRVLLGLNKGESLHSFAGELHYGRRGELRDRTYEDQLNAASSLNLLLAAAIVWNTVHLQACLKRLRADGKVIQEEDLRYLSPHIRQHIGIYGRYNFDLTRLGASPTVEDFIY